MVKLKNFFVSYFLWISFFIVDVYVIKYILQLILSDSTFISNNLDLYVLLICILKSLCWVMFFQRGTLSEFNRISEVQNIHYYEIKEKQIEILKLQQEILEITADIYSMSFDKKYGE